jgi:hypothetical protein
MNAFNGRLIFGFGDPFGQIINKELTNKLGFVRRFFLANCIYFSRYNPKTKIIMLRVVHLQSELSRS